MSEFRRFLEDAAARFPSKQAFATALGITPSRFSRLLQGQFSLEVVNCLRLAKLTGTPAPDVLRVAGKSDVAELLDELYGAPPPPRPSRFVNRAVKLLEGMNERWQRRAVAQIALVAGAALHEQLGESRQQKFGTPAAAKNKARGTR